MNSKTVLIILIFILVGLITFLGGYLIAQKNNGYQPASISNLSRFSLNSPPENQESPNPSKPEKFKRISTAKAFSPAISEDGKQVLYLERSSGKILASDFQGQDISAVSSLHIDNASQAAWSKNGYELIAVQNIKGGARSSYFNIKTGATAALNSNISNAVWSRNGQKIVYTFLNKETGEGNISISDPDGSSFKIILPTRAEGLKLDWAKDDRVSFYNTNGEDNSLFLLSTSDGRLEKVLDSLSGLRVLWSPDGSKLFYSYKDGEEAKAAILNADDKSSLYLDVVTEADKCVWTSDSMFVYCGGRQNKDSAENLYKFDLQEKEYGIVFEPSSMDLVEIKKPLLSPIENMLFFVNGSDQYLYAISLAE